MVISSNILCKNSIPYSEKFSREKFSQIGEKYDCRRENFRGLHTFAVPKDNTPQNFAEKTFANSYIVLSNVMLCNIVLRNGGLG